ncbi:ATP-binding protein [Streptomyces sp. NBC_01465]|uniref:ATP-binding protein n=1 Tax=Streptomyces sp. NBC_01465 TaxID=2903878 RepID=UPI002E31FE00|nr:ATP-binding protein [Streptomyces sp. NBC_01465]
MVETADRTEESIPDGGGTSNSAWQVLDFGVGAEEAARDFIGETLDLWGRGELSTRVQVAVGELVANALGHGLPQGIRSAFPHPVVVSLVREGPDVLVAVFDPGTQGPLLSTGQEGNGLRIVEAASDAWGWTVPGPYGKAVWAAFTAAGSGAGMAAAVGERLMLLVEVFTGSSEPRLVAAHPARFLSRFPT